MRPKGQAPPGRGSRQQSPAHAPSQTSSADDVLLHKVAKAVVAQADYTARLQASQTVLFTFKKDTGPHAMVPMMFQCAENWRQLKARTPTAVTRSLKQTLIQHLNAELLTRVEAFRSDAQVQRDAQSQGWVTPDLEFNFVGWHVETQALEPRQESNTLTIDQVLVDARRIKLSSRTRIWCPNLQELGMPNWAPPRRPPPLSSSCR